MPTPYCRVITEDLEKNKWPGEKSVVGVSGPWGNKMTPEEINGHEKSRRFRLLGDDKEFCCIGYFLDLSGTASGFEPKDDWGETSLGCTDIQYWESGKGGGWKSL